SVGPSELEDEYRKPEWSESLRKFRIPVGAVLAPTRWESGPQSFPRTSRREHSSSAPMKKIGATAPIPRSADSGSSAVCACGSIMDARFNSKPAKNKRNRQRAHK